MGETLVTCPSHPSASTSGTVSQSGREIFLPLGHGNVADRALSVLSYPDLHG